jgi:hypothetical protein
MIKLFGWEKQMEDKIAIERNGRILDVVSLHLQVTNFDYDQRNSRISCGVRSLILRVILSRQFCLEFILGVTH